MIVLGVDPHKKTHTVVAVDQAGRKIAELTFPARQAGFDKMLVWARALGDERRFALEDCRHVSGSLERFLLAHGEAALRVPPKLMAGTRRSSRTYGKSDPIDALAVARAALREPDLPAAALEGRQLDVRLLVDHRDDLVAQRTAIIQRLRWHLHDLDPTIEIPLRGLRSTGELQRLERRIRRMPSTTRVRIARQLLSACRALSKSIDSLTTEIGELVAALAPQLLAIPGCGVLTAAKLVGEIGSIERFASDAKLAVHAGVAPLPVSSGQRDRHRLNRRGNRQLNVALYRIVLSQARTHEPAKRYLQRKQTEGKSRLEAYRCLKRYIARQVFNALKQQQKSSSDPEVEDAA